MCKHNWIEDYNATDAAACYNDGFNYRPGYYICTKCQKRKKIKYDDGNNWYDDLSMIPLVILFFLYIGIVVPIYFIIGVIREEIFSKSKKRASLNS